MSNKEKFICIALGIAMIGDFIIMGVCFAKAQYYKGRADAEAKAIEEQKELHYDDIPIE